MKKNFVVIFDLDGTVLNTDTLIFKSFEHVFKKYFPEHKLTNEELLSFLGPSLKASFSRFTNDKVEECIEYYREFNHSHHEDYVTIYSHVKEVLEELKAKGYPLAIVTTKVKDAALIGLDLFDLTKYFDVILGMNEVKNIKPDPEGINKALEATNCVKGVMIGDNKSDILAGKNADIYTIAVKWSPKGYQEMLEIKPDLLIDDMSEIVEFIERMSEKC